MSTMSRTVCGFGIIAGFLATNLPKAYAMNGPDSIEIDGGPLGPLSLSGGADGYGYYLSGTGNESDVGDKSNGTELQTLIISIQKTTGPLEFTLEPGIAETFTLGTSRPAFQINNNESLNTLRNAYATLVLSPDLSISAGKMRALPGTEAGIDWYNSNVFTTLLYYTQNTSSLGVEGSLNKGPLSVSVMFGDGYNTRVFNYLQVSGTYTFNQSNNLTIYAQGPLGGYSGVNTIGAYGQSGTYLAPEYNSEIFGSYYSYTTGNLNLMPEVQYQLSKANSHIGLHKATSNFGAALFADYSFGDTPYSIGAWGQYWTSHQSASDTAESGDLWAIGPNAAAVGFSVTPTWQHKNLFARVDLGYMYLTRNSAYGVSYGFGNDGRGKSQFSGLLEAGLLL